MMNALQNPCTARGAPAGPAVPRRSRGASLAVRAAAASTEVDMEVSGLKYLPEAARERAQDKKANKFEKSKVAKCGSKAWEDIYTFAAAIREGKTDWESLDLDDIEVKAKWAGLFHRKKRAPGTFMMRLKIPNGEMTSEMLRFAADSIAPYGEGGVADITTRANLQLRGIVMEDADGIIDGAKALGISPFMSGMDNVRNLTGSPIAGVDPHELLDVRPMLVEMQDMITNGGKGRADLTNLPRKINICVSPSRDDFPHTHINDLGFEAVTTPEGELRFNVGIGGYFSVKRNTVSVPADISCTEDQVVPLSEAVLKAFRDHGPRGDRQKTRLMWLFEERGVEGFRDMLSEYIDFELGREVEVEHDEAWPRRDVLGVHPQKQEGMSWVGACVPAGRIFTEELRQAADIAEKYGDGALRLTCDENVIFANVPNDQVAAMCEEPLFQRWKVEAGPLERGMVSCTGSQFCGFALIETKNRAIEVCHELEAKLDIPQTVRMHWTGCPNSCGQAQVADIGLMGGPAKVDGKGVEGVKLFLGGTIGENPALATEFEKNQPAATEYLVPRLEELLKEKFGATDKA